MIARPQNRFKPIPFSNPLRHQGAHWSEPSPTTGLVPVQWQAQPMLATRLQAAEPTKGGERSPWGSLAQLTGTPGPAGSPERRSSNDASVSPSLPSRRPEPTHTGVKAPPKRSAMARYDGPHSLSIRSAASGRHYRFEHPGATQAIDAIDIALMRRIEDITLL